MVSGTLAYHKGSQLAVGGLWSCSGYLVVEEDGDSKTVEGCRC